MPAASGRLELRRCEFFPSRRGEAPSLPAVHAVGGCNVGRSPYVVVLSEADREVLEARARAYTAPHAEVVRAQIVLMAAGGSPTPDTVIAARRDVHVDVQGGGDAVLRLRGFVFLAT